MKEKIKVISYIFRNNKTEILVFDHRDFSEAGTQVVGGTVDPGEDLKTALVRELLEESGLVVQVSQVTKIGESTYNRSDKPEINFRHYFEVEIENLPDTWSHVVASDGEDDGLVFTFFWLPVEAARKVLTGNFGEKLLS